MAVLSYTFCFVDLVWVCVYFYIRFDVQCSFWIFLWYVFYHECWEWDVFDISAAVIFTSTNISYLIFSFSCLWQCWVLQTLFLTSRGLMPSGVVVKCCTRWRFFAVDQESVFNVYVLTYLPAWELCSLKNILLHWRLRRNWKKILSVWCNSAWIYDMVNSWHLTFTLTILTLGVVFFIW